MDPRSLDIIDYPKVPQSIKKSGKIKKKSFIWNELDWNQNK